MSFDHWYWRQSITSLLQRIEVHWENPEKVSFMVCTPKCVVIKTAEAVV